MALLIGSVAKELAESLIRSAKKIVVSEKVKENCKLESTNLQKNGFFVVENFLSENQCEEYVRLIDEFIDSGSNNIWSDEVGADNRIYFINTINEKFKTFYEIPYFRDVLEAYTGIKNPVGMLLAGRIDAVEGNLGSGGGWHRDSPVHHQTKAICYLSDVSNENGPFQYIPSSHSKRNVLKSYIYGIFKPGQYRFSESEIDAYLKFSNSEVLDMVAPTGTLLFADTKGIHRGKPIAEGRRYVLFCYFWDKKIPEHFEKLKQHGTS